jgi:hypothetical protein
MSVRDLGDNNFLVSGQVILSMPGGPCLQCCGFITDERLREEAELYGAAGNRPQVVWSNGVLASTAMGIVAQLLTPWFRDPPAFVYLEYDGNRGTVSKSAWMASLRDRVCPHYPPDETGDPFFDIRSHMKRLDQGRESAAGMISLMWKWWVNLGHRLRKP